MIRLILAALVLAVTAVPALAHGYGAVVRSQIVVAAAPLVQVYQAPLVQAQVYQAPCVQQAVVQHAFVQQQVVQQQAYYATPVFQSFAVPAYQSYAASAVANVNVAVRQRAPVIQQQTRSRTVTRTVVR